MESWVQFVIGPVMLLVIGWVLDRRVRRVDKKVEGATTAATTAAAASTAAAVSANTSATAVSEVRDHVVNDHSTILRNDVDDLQATVTEAVKVLTDLGALMRDLSAARERSEARADERHVEFREFRGEMLDFRAATDANHNHMNHRMDVMTERFDRHIDKR